MIWLGIGGLNVKAVPPWVRHAATCRLHRWYEEAQARTRYCLDLVSTCCLVRDLLARRPIGFALTPKMQRAKPGPW